MPEQTILKMSDSSGVGTITLNRPNVFNGYNKEFLIKLREVVTELESDRAVRLIMLRGAGKHFSAGADIHEIWMVASS